MPRVSTLPASTKLSKKFVGFSHYELTITNNDGSILTAMTDNMDLIERMNSELKEERTKATAEAIALVLEYSL